MRVHAESTILSLAVKVLDQDPTLFLWGAERPFQIQLLAGLGRLGMDVMAASTTAEGKQLVDKFYPKGSDSVEIPADFVGTIVWAPALELFRNSQLSPESLHELKKVLTQKEKNKVFTILPQSSYLHTQGYFTDENCHALYLPTVVGFGDQNIFEKTLKLAQDTGKRGLGVSGEFISAFDAVSFVLSALRIPKLPPKLWVKGSTPSIHAFQDGLNELENTGLGATLNYFRQKLLGTRPQYHFEQSAIPTHVEIANDFFPTVTTPWERFFRDAYRVYKSTPDDSLLLHFRPGKAP